MDIENLPRNVRDSIENAKSNVVVMDDLDIPDYLKEMAGLGSKFQFPGEEKDKKDLVELTATIMYLVDKVDSKTRNRVLEDYNKALEKFTSDGHCGNQTEMSPIRKLLSEGLEKSMEFMKQNPEIIITESDKGGRTVICKKETIMKKMQDFIEKQIQEGIYARIGKINDSTEQQQATRARIIKSKWLKYEHLRKRVNAILMEDRKRGFQVPRGGRLEREPFTLARMNVQIKTHKGNTYPIRPIIAAPGAMGSGLEEYILIRLEKLYRQREIPETIMQDCILKRVLENKHIIKEPHTVYKEISNMKLPAGHRVYSIDFANMYSNLDVTRAYNIIRREYKDSIERTTTMDVETFINTLDGILDINSTFTANNRLYKQAKGSPMGGKLSYAISEIITNDGIKQAIIEGTEKGLEIAYIAKYVDDILIIMYDDEEGKGIKEVMESISKFLPNMPTTMEKEEKTERMIRYLQINIYRKRNTGNNGQMLETKWSRPPYASTRMISTMSGHGKEVKRNIRREMFRAALALSSEGRRMEAVKEAAAIMWSNGHDRKETMEELREVCTEENVEYNSIIKWVNKEGTTAKTAGSGQTRSNETPQQQVEVGLTERWNRKKKAGKTASRKRAYRTCKGCGRHGRIYLSTRLKEENWKCHECIGYAGNKHVMTSGRKDIKRTTEATNEANNEEIATQTSSAREEMMEVETGGIMEGITEETGNDNEGIEVEGTTSEISDGGNANNERTEDRGTRSSGTQTTPTKGRPKKTTRMPYEQTDWGQKEMGMPTYIDAPYIEWLTDKAQRILGERMIPTKIASKTRRNPMFGNVKDQIPLEEKGRTIFSMTCRKCMEKMYLDAGCGTIGEEAQRALEKCKEGHKLDGDSIKKEIAYMDRRKVDKIMYILKDMVAGGKCPFNRREGTNPETRYDKIEPEMRKEIIKSFHQV